MRCVCLDFKPAFCEDMYSIPPKKNETKSLEDSFVGVLNHQFNETRRRNNPFARRSSNINRNTQKSRLPSANRVRELVLGVPTMHSNVVLLPILEVKPLVTSQKKGENINDLIQNIRKLHLSNSDTTIRKSRSRLRDPTSSSRLRSTTRPKTRPIVPRK